MGTNHIVEAVDGRKGNGSSKQLTHNQQQKLHSGHRISDSSSSSDTRNLEKPELVESSNKPSSGYEPNRIPSSIFGSRPGTATDWSMASNDSLFSIHLEDNSFSKNQFQALHKSGELTKLDEQIISPGGVMPSLKELEDMAEEDHEGNAGKGGFSGDKETETMVNNSSEVAEDDGSEELKFSAEVHNSPSTSRLSGLSDESTLSFAFPVLSGTDGGRTSSVNGSDRNNRELKTTSVKQEEQQDPNPKRSIKELKPPKTKVINQNGRGRNKFSWFRCCRHP